MKLTLSIIVVVAVLVVTGFYVRQHPSAPKRPPFVPDPEVLNLVDAALQRRQGPWLVPDTSDKNVPPGVSPATTILRSKNEPLVVKSPDGWVITFKP